MELVVPRNRSLTDLLSQATSSDLEVLADLITDSGKGRVALDSGIKAIILNRREAGNLQSISDVLEAEIRAFGGNSLLNLGRSKSVDYKKIVIDVAKELGGKIDFDSDIFAIEEIAIKEAIRKYKKTPVDKDVSRSVLLEQIVQGLVKGSGAFVGTIATMGGIGAAEAVVTRAASLLFPPLTLAAASGAAFQALGPAFRITIPAVLQVAKIRRSRFDADFASYTEGLRACQ